MKQRQIAGVFCKDERFFRLLTIQLEACRVEQIWDMASQDATMVCDLWLVDVDDFPLETLPCPPQDCAVFAFGRCPTTSVVCWEREIYIWHRPFSMALLEKNLMALIENAPVISLEAPPRHQVEETAPPDIKKDICILGDGEISVDDVLVHLTGKEWLLFECLWQNRGRVVSKEVLRDILRHTDTDMATNQLEVYICFLRRKLEKPTGKRYITTVRGVGYMIEGLQE